MKKLIIFHLFAFCILLTGQIKGQVCCFPQLVPVGNCCAELRIAFNANCPGPLDFRTIFIRSDNFPANAAKIDSWTDAPGGPVISGSITGNTILRLSSNSNLYSLGSVITLGTICFKDAVSSSVRCSVALTDSGAGISCESNIDASVNCPPVSNCTADFTWIARCSDVAFTARPTGTGPFTYAWDVNCNNPSSPEGRNATLNWSFPGTGTYNVCLTITDATGCSATVTKQVSVTDNPPRITCPGDQTISTDPGQCYATFMAQLPNPADDCTTQFFPNCTMSGATTGPLTMPVRLNKGATTITCRIEDSKGQPASCSYTITVVDNERPNITCPTAVTTSAPACDGGGRVFFNPPSVSDNCPMVSFISSRQSGDFFPCGTTMVTCTATDMAGNQSTCSFPVTVNCQCAEVSAGTIACTNVEDQFAFSINVIDNTRANANACTVRVSSSQTGVTLSNVVISGTSPVYTATGLITVAAPPIPSSISIDISVSCTCPDGTVHNCTFTRTLTTPCCKKIFIDPKEVCKVGGMVQIPITGCNTLYDLQQVRWYVADAPCPSGSWPPPFLVTNSCTPLSLDPRYHNGNICVYAEVFMGPDAGPCRKLVTDTVTITICEPISCSMSGNQQYCYIGIPIKPDSLKLSIINPTGCQYTIQWYDFNGNLIRGATGLSYQPNQLILKSDDTGCYKDFTYTAVITGASCPDQRCSVNIRLYNDDAPLGSLKLLPPDRNPLCYGEDAVLEYNPRCAGEPERWDWFIRPDVNPTYTPLTSNGDRNPLYYTNRLYEDTWVKVEKTNGVCPKDEIEILLDIIDPISIQIFKAVYPDPCFPRSVDIAVSFRPQTAPPGCLFTVTWYRNGQIIGTSTTTGLSANFIYAPPVGTPLFGNYYCVVNSSCCPGPKRSQVVTLDPPMEVYVAGPCFCCNCDPTQLKGIVLYPTRGYNCTYQWYKDGVLLPGETGLDLAIDTCTMGMYTFEVTCSIGSLTCIKSASFDLRKCEVYLVGTQDQLVVPSKVYPNPTNDFITIELENELKFEIIEVFDAQGKRVMGQKFDSFSGKYQLDVSRLPAGNYLIRAVENGGKILLEKIVKQ